MARQVPRRLRRLVRERARSRCEYCLIHEEDALIPHVPDHIISRRHGGRADAANLAWACYLCNHLESSDIASIDLETGKVLRLFNPRKDKWATNFRLKDGYILPLTAIGRVTEYFLQFNQPFALETRQALIEAVRYPR